MWDELTILWNDLTILWNDLTIDWNDLTWNDLTMERNDRIPLKQSEASKKRSDRDFSRMLIVMSVKPTLTEELLKVNSAVKLIFSVIEDQCSGGQ